MDQPTHPPTEKLATALFAAMRGRGGPDGVTLGEVVDHLGTRGIALILLMLSFPSALPVPAPGYSTPFGVAIVIVTAQLFFPTKRLWLPGWLRKRRISLKMVDQLERSGGKVLEWSGRWIQPRYGYLLALPVRWVLSLVVLMMGVLMIFPIPLTNTAPAIVVFIIAMSLAEEDGLAGLFGFLIGCAAVLLYAVVVVVVIQYGPEGIDLIKDFVRSWLAGGGDAE